MSHGMNSDSEDDSTWHEELSLPYSIEEQLNGFKKLQPGTVVQISFDAYHSLKSLRDPTLDCHTTRRRRHLALILSKRGRLVGDIPICTVEYMLVSEGLPRFNPRRGTKDSMCLPILPCTTHPERRAPLEPSPPFPLPNHYVYTSDIYVSRVGNVIGSDSMVPPRFRTEEMKWLQNIQRRDYNHGVLVRVAERHRMMMSKQSPHSTWEDAEHEAAQNPSTCDSPNDTGSLMSAPISLGINWPFEISELREQLSQLPEDQWAIREALALEGVDDTRKLKNPLSIGQCRWRETTIDAWVDQEDWLACSDGHNFARERERLCKMGRHSDRRWLSGCWSILQSPNAFKEDIASKPYQALNFDFETWRTKVANAMDLGDGLELVGSELAIGTDLGTSDNSGVLPSLAVS